MFKKRFTVILICIFCITTLVVSCGQTSQTASTTTTAESTTQTTSNTTTTTQSTAKESNDTDSDNLPAGSLVTENGAMPVVTEPYVITVLEAHNSPTMPFADNRFTTWYEEQSGVKLDFKYSLGSDFNEKFNAIMASGDYPEMFIKAGWLGSNAQIIDLGHQGLVQPIEDYIDNYSVHLKSLMKEKTFLRDNVSDPDTGHMYGLPGAEEYAAHRVWSKLFVYKPWLEKMSIDYPVTTDDFEQMLIAFKENDPNGNGTQDEVPLAFDGSNLGNWAPLISPFVYWDNGNYLENNKDSKLSFNANSEGFRNAIRWLHHLYEQGLFSDDIFTGVDLRMLGENTEPILGVSIGHYMGVFTLAGDLTSNRFREYDMLTPLTGPTGERYATYALYDANYRVVLTDKMKNPEVAVRWADWFYTVEGTICGMWGLKGEAWDDPPEQGFGLTGFPYIWNMLKQTTENELVDYAWQWSSPHFRSREINEGVYMSDEVAPFDYDMRTQAQAVEAYEKKGVYTPEKAYPKFVIDAENNQRLSDLRTPMATFINATFADMVLGNQNVETDWEAYCAELDAMGWEEYLSIYQELLDKFNNN